MHHQASHKLHTQQPTRPQLTPTVAYHSVKYLSRLVQWSIGPCTSHHKKMLPVCSKRTLNNGTLMYALHQQSHNLRIVVFSSWKSVAAPCVYTEGHRPSVGGCPTLLAFPCGDRSGAVCRGNGGDRLRPALSLMGPVCA